MSGSTGGAAVDGASGKPVRIVLAGDSTVTEHEGWGTGFRRYLRPEVEVINLAQCGRSSKSFRDEGHWGKVRAARGHYVLIQFGHNDQPGKGPERETDPATTYRDNLRRYVREARQDGARPILVTSLIRRKFTDGRIRSDLTEYVDAAKVVASELDVPLLDLHERSLAYCNQIGPTGCEAISPRKADGGVDTTHLNQQGSLAIGRLVVEELAKVVPALAACCMPAATDAEVMVNG